jgi:hypothetical protein
MTDWNNRRRMKMNENEQENEKRETLADIVAEMRMGDDGGKPAYRIGRADKVEISMPSGQPIRSMVIEEVHISELADRLEAAAKRENAQSGNAAAMRETLVLCSRIIGANGIHGNVFLDDIEEAHRAITAALSEPARNCDIYKNKKDAEAAFISEECKHPCGNCTVNDEYGCALVHECGVDWLFAPSAERKGEGDGR